MCLIFVAWRGHPRYRLVIAANRDEFHARPTAPAAFWADAPEVLAGRDLQAGGTWLGVTRSGRFAAITNYRDPADHRDGARSRGALVRSYLASSQTPADFLVALDKQRHEYNGFNLLAGDTRELYYYASRTGESRRLVPGVYGLSNQLLDTPWPKVKHGKAAFERCLAVPEPTPAAFFEALADRSVAPDAELPDTGVGRDWERVLAPAFITSPNYGTRSSTVLRLDQAGKTDFVERSFDAKGNATGTVQTGFQIGSPAG